MSDLISARPLPHLNVGILGHYQHGKTTLASALAKVASERYRRRPRWPSVEELGRGSRLRGPGDTTTIDPRDVELETPYRNYSLLDAPGHRDWLKNTAGCAELFDAAVLVVAVNESVMPQTREHLLVAKQAGAQRVAVFISKCDLADDPAWLDAVEEDTRQLLVACGFPGDDTPVLRGAAGPVLEGSPVWTPTLLALLDAIDGELPTPARAPEGRVVLPVHGVFSRPEGVVVTGQVRRGVLRRGAEVSVQGLGRDPRVGIVSSLELYGRKVNEALPGDLVGVQLRGVPRASFTRGQVLVGTRADLCATRFECALRVLPMAEGGRHTPLFSGHRGQFYLASADVTGTVTLPTSMDSLGPGQRALAEVELQYPAWLEAGMGFSFRDGCDGFRKQRGGDVVWGGTAATGVVTRVLE